VEFAVLDQCDLRHLGFEERGGAIDDRVQQIGGFAAAQQVDRRFVESGIEVDLLRGGERGCLHGREIDIDADDAPRASGRVALGDAAQRADPAPFAGFGAQAQFDFIAWSLAVLVGSAGGDRAVVILGVNQLAPAFARRRNLARGIAEDLRGQRLEIDVVGDEIPLPGDELAAVERALELGAAVLQLALAFVQFRGASGDLALELLAGE
jgi:hypothetical protein